MKKCIFAVLVVLATPAYSKVSAEQAARLGQDLTRIGAEKAAAPATPHGLSIPAYAGGFSKPNDSNTAQVPADPYAADEPLLVIDSSNAGQYADILSVGQQALLKNYPTTFRMRVYPTRRSAAVPEHVAQATQANATAVELKPGGNGFTGTAHGFPFPIPASGQELIWNHMARYRTTGFRGFTNSAATTSSGSYVVERAYLEAVIQYGNPDIALGDWDNDLAMILRKVVAPANKAGDTVLLHVPMDREADDIQIWSYNPGTRKVRRIAEVGYDNPAQDGLITHDQVDMFNGPLDRYNFKLIGKKAVLVPYNNYALHSPDVKYADIVHKGHPNPDLLRYELHRTWVLEATIKDDVSHVYSKRVMYLDEDSWLILLADMYDQRGEFWRTSMAFALQYPQIPLPDNSLQAHFDLQSRRYVMLNMQNEERTPMSYNHVAPPSHFTTSALKRFATQQHR
ncbi:hypothetical protein ATO7_12548 [Oceanococcus atlanticus]|uniref:DUF1329 domain-containing protein n=1 Tax=Oceanococcus atlanticus TaxID=1317117 RepID=A0A1Y1SCT6_9GAMM|nr:DUF1329 domain-containing protein [Oceanococcus atlanticus]ORE86125.1 hypothetical protein ATO7_12548 [Oceanococcus atlanticus]